jgi:hypothetical protein
MAIGVWWRGVDLSGADGVHARGDRLEEPTADLAAQECRIARWIGRVDETEKIPFCVHFGAPQIMRSVIHFASWMLIAPLLPKKSPV